MDRIPKSFEIINKIRKKWNEQCEQFYICYTVKELAYKITYELFEEYYGKCCNNTIFCKEIGDKWEIAIHFEQEIYFTFDIWWATGAFGDTGLHCGCGIIEGKLPDGFEDIEYVLEDVEED